MADKHTVGRLARESGRFGRAAFRVFACFGILALSFPAGAEDIGSLKRGAVPDGDIGSLKRGAGDGGVASASEALVISVPLCREYISHRAAPGTNYRPGAENVAPADTGGASGASMIPDPIRLPINIDTAQRMGLSVDGLEMFAQFPPVDVYSDGRVIWQGQDIGTQVRNLCEEKPPLPVKPAAAAAQADPNRIERETLAGSQESGQQKRLPVGSGSSGTKTPEPVPVVPSPSGSALSGGQGDDIVQ